MYKVEIENIATARLNYRSYPNHWNNTQRYAKRFDEACSIEEPSQRKFLLAYTTRRERTRRFQHFDSALWIHSTTPTNANLSRLNRMRAMAETLILLLSLWRSIAFRTHQSVIHRKVKLTPIQEQVCSPTR